RTPSPHSEASDLHHTASHSFPTRRSSDLPQWNCTFCWQGHDYTAAVELVIHVPRQTNIKLESYKPEIKIAGIQGDIRVKSYKSRSEEHTSELQSRGQLVCRLLLEKKKTTI